MTFLEIEVATVQNGAIIDAVGNALEVINVAYTPPSTTKVNGFVLPFRVKKVGYGSTATGSAGGFQLTYEDASLNIAAKSLVYFKYNSTPGEYDIEIISAVDGVNSSTTTISGMTVSDNWLFMLSLHEYTTPDFGLTTYISDTPDIFGELDNAVKTDTCSITPTLMRLKIRKSNLNFSIVECLTPEKITDLAVTGLKAITHSLFGTDPAGHSMIQSDFTANPTYVNIVAFVDYDKDARMFENLDDVVSDTTSLISDLVTVLLNQGTIEDVVDVIDEYTGFNKETITPFMLGDYDRDDDEYYDFKDIYTLKRLLSDNDGGLSIKGSPTAPFIKDIGLDPQGPGGLPLIYTDAEEVTWFTPETW